MKRSELSSLAGAAAIGLALAACAGGPTSGGAPGTKSATSPPPASPATTGSSAAKAASPFAAGSPSPSSGALATATPHAAGGRAGAAGLIVPPGLPRYDVVSVADGETVFVEIDGQPVGLSLIGFTAPKLGQGGQPGECFSDGAYARAREMLEGKRVWIQDDPSQGDRDSFGRPIRYVWLPDGSLFQLEMIASGHGFEFSENNSQYALRSLFRSTQQEAQKAERGLWSPATCRGRPETRLTPAASTAASGY